MRLNLKFLLAFLSIAFLTGCEEFFDQFDGVRDRVTEVTNVATGLQTPFGLEVDSKRQVWVSEAGSGTGNTGRVSVITQDGTRYTAVEGFPSVIDPEGNASGLNHLYLQDGVLYILHGANGRLYRLDVNDYQIGDEPFDADDLEYDEIGEFVSSYPWEVPIDETNPFNLTAGPNGDLFIVDAGANAIIRRQTGTGELSVFASFPDLDNPSGVGPPAIDVVPTGIAYDGKNFYVSALTGFPFLPGYSRIYRVDRDGNVSEYQTGFTSLTDLELGAANVPMVTEYGSFGEMGFNQNTGRVVLGSGSRITTVTSGLNFPTAIKKWDTRTYFIGFSADGSIKKLTYF
jgi:hypothetical protein